MRSEGIPRHIIEHMHDGNKEALRAAGKAGARAKEKKKEAAKTAAQVLAKLREAEFAHRALETGVMNEDGDMVHPDDLPQ